MARASIVVLTFLLFIWGRADAQVMADGNGPPPPDRESVQWSSDGPRSLADGLYMQGQFTASFAANYTSVTVRLDRINNDSYSFTSGTLRLSLWATSSYPARGAGFTGYRLATFSTLSPLPPRNYYYDIVRTSSMSVPPNGTYWMVLVLEEYDTSLCSDASGYCLTDSGVFDEQRTFGVVTYPVTVTKAGSGSGTVASSPAGISCGSTCSATFASGTSVTLAAVASSGSTFSGWSGACTGSGACTVSVTAARAVTATFTSTISTTSIDTMVTHYYNAILRRAPDAGGTAYWRNEAVRVSALGGNINEVWFAMAMSFFTSAEYTSLGKNDFAFVTDLYLTFFNRAPDSGGLTYWLGQLTAGMPREVALAQYMFSAEFKSFTQGIFGNTSARPEVDAVMDFYRGILSRLPDSDGFVYWVQRFRTAQCAGSQAVYADVEAISTAYTGSPEYVARNRTNAQFVGDMYNAFLRRGGDLAGVQYWIGQLQTGARTRSNVRQQFLASPEFSGRVSAIIAQGCLF